MLLLLLLLVATWLTLRVGRGPRSKKFSKQTALLRVAIRSRIEDVFDAVAYELGLGSADMRAWRTLPEAQQQQQDAQASKRRGAGAGPGAGAGAGSGAGGTDSWHRGDSFDNKDDAELRDDDKVRQGVCVCVCGVLLLHQAARAGRSECGLTLVRVPPIAAAVKSQPYVAARQLEPRCIKSDFALVASVMDERGRGVTQQLVNRVAIHNRNAVQ